MLFDARSMPAGKVLKTEVCIVGSGPAGMAIALELERAGVACVLLESGGHRRDEATADLNRGLSAQLGYDYGDGYRSRFLGGSSNCWGGFCRPWDEQAFWARDWVAGSGWPIGLAQLQAYYDRAAPFLQISQRNFLPETWQGIARQLGSRLERLPLDADGIEEILTQLSPPVRLGKIHRAHLDQSELIQTYLYANVVDLPLEEGAARVKAVKVKTLTGSTFSVSANRVVLAAGGIENPRLLLNANSQQCNGLGNRYGVVGRYFQDHPRIFWGDVKLAAEYRHNPLYDLKFHCIADDLRIDGQRIGGQMRLPFSVQQREQLLDAQVCFRSTYVGESDGLQPVLHRLRTRLTGKRGFVDGLLADSLKLGRHPYATLAYIAAHLTASRSAVRRVGLDIIVEPEPDPDSRLVLSDKIDALGLRRARIDWRLSDRVWRTFEQTAARISQTLEQHGIAQVLPDQRGPINPETTEYEGTYHHMGTTRMHESPRQGVVNADCRVHGVENLFIAGSSVFPTSSGNHPTMTLTALALRLADHLVDQCRHHRISTVQDASVPAGSKLSEPALLSASAQQGV